MPRARNIKPGFFKNEELAQCEPQGRLLFVALWCEADRDGRLLDRPLRLKAEYFPYDSCNVDALLAQLAGFGLIERYEANGCKYIAIPKFRKHQNPHRDEPSKNYPSPGNIAPLEHDASTVPTPCEHESSTEARRLNQESGMLNPDPCILNPESNTSKVSNRKALSSYAPSTAPTPVPAPTHTPAPVGLSDADFLEISSEEVATASLLADSLFKRTRFIGDDGELFWKISALVGRSILAEGWVHEAAEQVQKKPRKRPAGYFRITLREICAKRGVDLEAQLSRVRMPRGSPTSAPKRVGSILEEAKAFGRIK